MQNKNPVKQGHELNILFYRVLFTGSILDIEVPFLLLKLTFVELTIGCSMIVKRYSSKETAEFV